MMFWLIKSLSSQNVIKRVRTMFSNLCLIIKRTLHIHSGLHVIETDDQREMISEHRDAFPVLKRLMVCLKV